MALIDLKFALRGEYRIGQGWKRCTTRRGRHGVEGDTFLVAGKLYKIRKIEAMPLKEIASLYYYDEGYRKPRYFLMAIDRLYMGFPRKGCVRQVPRDTVMYVHHFEAV